jgi:hypothetical protein
LHNCNPVEADHAAADDDHHHAPRQICGGSIDRSCTCKMMVMVIGFADHHQAQYASVACTQLHGG